MHITLNNPSLIIVCYVIFTACIYPTNGSSCTPPDGFELLAPDSKFLFKTGSSGIYNNPEGLFNSICIPAKLEPWLPRSNADFSTYKKFYEKMDASIRGGKRWGWYPIGVFHSTGHFYAWDKTTLLQDEDWESSFKQENLIEDEPGAPRQRNCLQFRPSEVEANYMETQPWASATTAYDTICQWPKDSECYKKSKEEKELAIENEGPKFQDLCTSHAGQVVIGRRQRGYQGAKEFCAENGMRMISWNELDFKNCDVIQAVIKYRAKQIFFYPYNFWVDAIGDNVPTMPKPKSRKKRDADDGWPPEWAKQCWSHISYAENGVIDETKSKFVKVWCTLPVNVVCMKEAD